MANYSTAFRTSYFRVTDKKRFNELLGGVSAELFTKRINGETYYGFGDYGDCASFDYTEPASCNKNVAKMIKNNETLFDADNNPAEIDKIDSYSKLYDKNKELVFSRIGGDSEGNTDMFAKELQKILHPKDACVIIEVGHEKLRYVDFNVTIITKTTIDYMNSDSYIKEIIKKRLGDDATVAIYY